MNASRVALPLIAVAAACGGRVRAASNCPRADLPAYAHNDYQNPHPLYDALSLGYQGTEADVFLVGGELRLGHERRVAAADGNFESLYLAPLRAVIARCGHFTADEEPFLLTIELKERSRPTFDTLVALLGRYQDLFASDREDGTTPAVQAVLVGWYPTGFADSITIPLSRQTRLENTNGPPADAGNRDVGLIGVDYNETIGRRWQTPAHRRRWLSAIRQTKAAFPGLRIRAYHVPVDQRLYDELLDAGVDLIGTADLVKTAGLLPRISTPAP
jgi:hypothetical protein